MNEFEETLEHLLGKEEQTCNNLGENGVVLGLLNREYFDTVVKSLRLAVSCLTVPITDSEYERKLSDLKNFWRGVRDELLEELSKDTEQRCKLLDALTEIGIGADNASQIAKNAIQTYTEYHEQCNSDQSRKKTSNAKNRNKQKISSTDG